MIADPLRLNLLGWFDEIAIKTLVPFRLSPGELLGK
jgi:hypothetical protein